MPGPNVMADGLNALKMIQNYRKLATPTAMDKLQGR